MDLTAELNDLKQQLGRELPKEILTEIGQFVQGLAQSGIEKTSCQVGDRIPPFSLPNISGEIVSSEEILSKGPMVLSFYRGVW